MPGTAIGVLIDLLDRSFDGDDEHSLLGNLRHVRPEDWDWRPPDARRTVREIVDHAAAAKHAYAEHLFGPAQRTFSDVLRASPSRSLPGDTAALLEWARAGHTALTDGVAMLADSDLARLSRTHWGMPAQTGWIIGIMVQHDCYHAGEINHIRALCQGDDGWWPEFADS